jgi:hypothetical protein
LASRWRLLLVRKMAIKALELKDSLTPVEKICLGRDLSIHSWVVDGFVGLVEATTITDEEAIQIDSGAETTAYKLFRILEIRPYSVRRTKVEEVFKEELDRHRAMEETFTTDEKLELDHQRAFEATMNATDEKLRQLEKLLGLGEKKTMRR